MAIRKGVSSFTADVRPAQFIVARYMENGALWYFDGIRFQEDKRNAKSYALIGGAQDIAYCYDGFVTAV